MRSDKEGRFFIPRWMREISGVEPGKKVAVCMKDRNTVYLVPNNEKVQGRILGIRTVEENGRISMGRFLTRQESQAFDYELYLERGVIYIGRVEV